MSKFDSLRGAHPEFVYRGFSFSCAENLEIEYHFEIPNLVEFKPRWVFPVPADYDASPANTALERLIFELGMVELISYWKAVCSPKVIVQAGSLSEEQIAFWKKQYFNGLGEFFYVNNIRTGIDDFMSIVCSVEKNFDCSRSQKGAYEVSGIVIPIGGGKDSAVTLELLKGQDNLAYIINPRGASLKTAQIAGYEGENLCQASRTIDPELLRLNAEGYLNGHTPFSAIVAFSSLIVAEVFDKEYIALSNESSANESTVEGENVNHQYSKSYEFEQDFREYVSANELSNAKYFSMLRPLSEYQIAALFANLCPSYFQDFRSCNVGSKKDIWCCNCPKCLFVYVILSPFLTQTKLTEIFGENLLDKPELLPYFQELIGVSPNKPFECVGSRDEICQALADTAKKLQSKNNAQKLPYLLENFIKNEKLYKVYADRQNPYLDFYDNVNALPPKFSAILKLALEEIEL